MNKKWVFKCEEGNHRIKWFLVDEGKIQYAFVSRNEAIEFKNEFQLNYMLLTDIEHITNDTMIDPDESRSWVNKQSLMCLLKSK